LKAWAVAPLWSRCGAGVERAEYQGMEVVIPPKKNRKVMRGYDSDLYKYRYFVENAFLHLKRWRV
jgi:hypothetical protein